MTSARAEKSGLQRDRDRVGGNDLRACGEEGGSAIGISELEE